MLAGVFSLQGFGQLAAALVSFTLIETLASDKSVETVWRWCLGIGAVPGILMFYFRFAFACFVARALAHYVPPFRVTLEETQHYSKLKPAKVNWRATLRKYGLRLFGTAGSWCLFDITFYANGLFAATVLKILGIGTPSARKISLTYMSPTIQASMSTHGKSSSPSASSTST